MRLFHRVAAVLALAACDESPDAWRARMAAELDRSLALYARPRDADEAEQLVRRLLGDPYRSVLVLRNRLIFDRRLFSRAKVMHHVEFVRSVMEAGPSDNSAYQFEWNANGANSEDQLVREGCPTPAAMPRRRVKPKSWAAQPRQSPIPRVVIAKRYGGGRLGPGRGGDGARRDAARGPDPRLFWRGAIRTRDDCEDEFGNFARAEAVALTARDPASFDVRCLQCDVRDGAANPCDRPVFSAATRRDVLSLGRAAHANRSVYGAYQFQLNLPGSVSGSYSRNLNHLWLLGSAVALWDAPYVEWYYPALTAGVTHLAVDAGTARAALDAARRRANHPPVRRVPTELRNARPRRRRFG
ncbi:hypothetical protein JL722_6731 [Aureococcus anophagefferens]|nr:hypothetical protein JL722_6731 [Aureococcus anophagefferens]